MCDAKPASNRRFWRDIEVFERRSRGGCERRVTTRRMHATRRVTQRRIRVFVTDEDPNAINAGQIPEMKLRRTSAATVAPQNRRLALAVRHACVLPSSAARTDQ
jgi:hypothetical protein